MSQKKAKESFMEELPTNTPSKFKEQMAGPEKQKEETAEHKKKRLAQKRTERKEKRNAEKEAHEAKRKELMKASKNLEEELAANAATSPSVSESRIAGSF
jgi:hypothetical protein